MPPGLAGINVRKTARKAGEDRGSLHRARNAGRPSVARPSVLDMDDRLGVRVPYRAS